MATCEITKVIPGPRGPAGNNGSNGSNGVDAFTTLLANFTVPAIGGTAIANVGSSAWITIGQPLYLQNGGVFYATALPDSTHVTLQNPAAETGNIAAGTVIPIASKLSPSGFKGVAGSSGSAGGGVTVAAKGDIQTYAAAPANLSVGTDGQMIRARSAAGNGIDWATIVPNATAATDDNKIAVANTPVGNEKPAPLQFMPAKVTDTGAYQTVGGNARGVDAVDQQPARAANTQVASGNNSTISGGRNNTASAQGSSVAGGEGNVASGVNSGVSFGASNTASGLRSSILGGQNNVASNVGDCIIGGDGNTASGGYSAILSGASNVASGQGSVAFGEVNTASATSASTLGGISNIASAIISATIGGFEGRAELVGQIAHSSGKFLTIGDAQTSEIIFKVQTSDATANTEAFIGPAGQRATMFGFSSWAFHIITIARNINTSLSAVWETKGGLKRSGAPISLIGVVSHALIANDGEAWMLPGNVVVDADAANVSLRVRVTGAAATTINWVSYCRLVQVSY